MLPQTAGVTIVRWRVEQSLIGIAGADRLGHPVVDLQDDPFSSVFTVRGLVFLPDDWEVVEDVTRVVAG